MLRKVVYCCLTIGMVIIFVSCGEGKGVIGVRNDKAGSVGLRVPSVPVGDEVIGFCRVGSVVSDLMVIWFVI